MSHEFIMKARHWAALSCLIITVASIAIFTVVKGLQNDPAPKTVGEFEFEGTRTKIIQAGDCQIYATKWKAQPEPRFFFSCKPK